MKQSVFACFLAVLLYASCTSSAPSSTEQPLAYNEAVTIPGDSAVYGLACEGCTDSLLVYLPFSGGDPDTIDILNARIQRRVFGRPSIGDQLAILLNATNKSVADMVVNIDVLEGTWCYMVTPKLRPRAGMSPDSVVQLPPNLPDSLRKKWFEPREYSLDIRNDFTARTIGVRRTTEMQQGPTVYPELKRYREWHLFNGRLLLSETRRDSLGETHVISTDTADILLLRPDTLVLSIAGTEQGYYRKK